MPVADIENIWQSAWTYDNAKCKTMLIDNEFEY